MDAKSKRAALALALVEALPDGWTVYASPPETVTAPSVVIGPRAPYREWGTFGTEDVNLQLSLLVPRALGASALDVLDEVLDTVLEAVDSVDNAMPMATALGLTQTSAAGVEYLTAAIDVTVKG